MEEAQAMMLREAMEREMRHMDAHFAEFGYNSLEHGITAAEVEIFDIELERYARMFAAWDAYAALVDLHTTFTYSPEALRQARMKYPDIVAAGNSEAGFIQFAQDLGGLTMRECDAITETLRWRAIRGGHIAYRDELGDTDDDED